MAQVRTLAAKYEAALQAQLFERKPSQTNVRYAATKKRLSESTISTATVTSSEAEEEEPVTARRPRGVRVRAMTHVLEMRVREEAISKFISTSSTSPITSETTSPTIPNCPSIAPLPSAKQQTSYIAPDPASRSSTLTNSSSVSQPAMSPVPDQLLDMRLDDCQDTSVPKEPAFEKSKSHAPSIPSVSSHRSFHSFNNPNSSSGSLSPIRVTSSVKLSQFPSPPAIDDMPDNASISEYSFSDGSLENVQLLEDPEDYDLDNIDGAEHVEDCDSQAGSESDTGTVLRADTIKDFDFDIPSLDIPSLELPKHSDMERYKCPDSPKADIAYTRAKLMRKGSSRRPRPQSAPLPSIELPSTARNTSGVEGGLKPYREESRNVGVSNRQSIDRVIVDSSSLKKLPKAKVMIARKRSHSINSDVRAEPKSDFDSGIMPHSSPAGLETPRPAARCLVREYSNPKELFEGPIRMLDDDDETRPIEPKVERVETSVRREREEVFKNRYDEFLDAEEIATKRHGKIIEDLSYGGNFAPPGASKEKYRNKKKLFGGKRVSNIDKDRQRTGRQERHMETIRRRSTFVSGALDRVSMAADPWIDFITDGNAMPAARAGGPFRRAMKRLFRRGKQDMIRY